MQGQKQLVRCSLFQITLAQKHTCFGSKSNLSINHQSQNHPPNDHGSIAQRPERITPSPPKTGEEKSEDQGKTGIRTEAGRLTLLEMIAFHCRDTLLWLSSCWRVLVGTAA